VRDAMSTDIAKMVFNKWNADFTKLSSGEKLVSDSPQHFGELFYAMYSASVSKEKAEEYISQAVRVMMPTHLIITKTWNRCRKNTPGLEYNEWLAGWKRQVEDNALAAFETYFPTTELSEDDDEPYDPNIYNGMSKKEYALQQIYVSQFKVITREEIEAVMKRQKDFEEEERHFLEENGLTIEDLFFGDKKDGTPKC